MATQGRRADPSVAELLLDKTTDGKGENIKGTCCRFDFFQAVRVLSQLNPTRRLVGRDGPPGDEVVRFRSHLSLSFPPSAIQEIVEEKPGQRPATMTVNFMGLTGPSGVLPYHYTELLMERMREKDTTFREFLDLFNHRLISLFYRVWEKHHVEAGLEQALERGKEEDKVSRYLFALMGLATKGLRHRVVKEDRSLLCYAGLVGQRPRSASALQQWLTDYFEVPVGVEQLVGAWFHLEEDDLTRLGPGEKNNVLGRTAIAGTSVWDQQARFRLRMGPLNFREFSRILPSGRAYPSLVRLTRFFVGPTLDFDVRPILKRTEVPECRLAQRGEYAPYLGWTTWLKTKEFATDTEDVSFTGQLPIESTVAA